VNHSWVKNNNPLVHIIHSYDDAGNRTKRHDAVHATNSELYNYDNLGQIKSLNRGVLNNNHTKIPTVNHSESWNFDKTGNWLQYTKNGNTENRTHNAANELQGIATHDANGNMILMPGLKGKFDAWNRLVEVRDSTNNLIATYEYNGLNQRIKKTVNGVVTKSFFNENWQELESQTGNEIISYVWGLCYIDDLVLREKGEERLYSLADPNWNVVAVCNDSGDVQERYTYDAFGKRNVFDADFTAKTETEFDWNRAFTGQVIDAETGLMLYRERYYDVEFGRFINRDPIEYWDEEINFYCYVANAPTTYVDIWGMSKGGKGNPRPSEIPSKWGEAEILDYLKKNPNMSKKQKDEILSWLKVVKRIEKVKNINIRSWLWWTPPAIIEDLFDYLTNPDRPPMQHCPFLGPGIPNPGYDPYYNPCLPECRRYLG
jgi:RHS repeat-associated protein